MPEDRQIFPEHSVEDNLLIGAKPGLGGRYDWTLKTIYDVFPMLGAMRGRMGGRLSGGEQQMLTIARTRMGNPDLLLDEPSEGLAPSSSRRSASSSIACAAWASSWWSPSRICISASTSRAMSP